MNEGPGFDPSTRDPPMYAGSVPSAGYDFKRISSKADITQDQQLKGNNWSGRAMVSLILGIFGFILLVAVLFVPQVSVLTLILGGIGLGLSIHAYIRMKRASSTESFGITIVGMIVNGLLVIFSLLVLISVILLWMSSFSSSSGTAMLF